MSSRIHLLGLKANTMAALGTNAKILNMFMPTVHVYYDSPTKRFNVNLILYLEIALSFGSNYT